MSTPLGRPHDAAPRRFWPRRLGQQMLLMVLLIVVVAMAMLYRVSTHRLGEVALQSSSEWAAAVARSAASAGAEPLAQQDMAGLQMALQDIASLPGVLAIDTYDPAGAPLLSLHLAPDGKRVTSHWRLRNVEAPPADATETSVQFVDGQRRLKAWAPIGPDGTLGIVGVSFTLDREHAHVDRLRYDAVMGIAFAGLLTGVGAWLLLRSALAPLQRVIDFSRGLAEQPGAQLDGHGGSHEVAELTQVLNDASSRLRQQLDTIRASEENMAAMLQALAERTARLNAVFELSPDGFVLFDNEGRLVFCNQVFEQMTGWAPASLAGLTTGQFDQRLADLCEAGPLAAVAGDDQAADALTLKLRLPKPRVLARTLRRRDDAQGGTVLYFRDVTHETEVDRMKSEFLTTAAHELRTPMVSVFGFTELLLNRPVPEARRRDMLETIHRQSTLLINMVNELLDLARIEARGGKDLKPRECRVGELVREATAGVLVGGDARVVRLALAHEAGTVRVDPDKLVRALTNVLSNAFKYSPGGGEILLESVDGRLGERPAVGLRVTDHGIGMTPAQLARVFERFYRADPSGNIPGTGLGMSLVKEIVELHRGHVEVTSRAGEGTTVTLWLPLVTEGSAAPAGAAPVHALA